MAILLQSGRSQLSASDWSISVTTGGNLTTGSYYLSLQGENIIGRNLLLQSSLISVSDNDQITITINQSALLLDTNNDPIEGWRYFIIGVSSSTDPTTFKQLAKIPAFDVNSPTTLLSFPLSLNITEDDQLNAELVVADPAALPTTNLINGMIREVTSLNAFFVYNVESTETVNNSTVLSAATGRWELIGTNSTYQDLTDNFGGCDQDLVTITEVTSLNVPDYNPIGVDSMPISFWLLNNTTYSVPAGTRITLNIFLGNIDKSRLFSGRIKYQLDGYVDTTDYSKRTTVISDDSVFSNLNVEENYTFNQPAIALPDELQANEAAIITVKLNFHAIEVDGYLPNTFLQILPQFVPTVGSYTSLGSFIGDGIIYNTYDRRRLVASSSLSALALEGEGFVKSYYFTKRDESVVTGFAANTSAQKALINKNGVVYYTALATPADSVIRALVDTTAGESIAATWSSTVTVGSSGSLTITCNYPCDANGNGTVRTNYPDVIAGNSQGVFNPLYLNIYVQKITGGEIRKFSNISVVPDVAQDVVIPDFSTGTVVGSVPSVEFGLYKPGSVSFIDTGGGSFAADDYRVTYSFVYDGNQITNISHKTIDGCVAEADQSISDLFVGSYWGDPVALKQDLRDYAVSQLKDNLFVWVEENDKLYRYDAVATDTDDDDLYLTHTNSGTWVQFVSGGGGGGGGGGGLTALEANTTLYVSTTGDDNNDGLTVGAPITLQTALYRASNYVFNGYNLTIQLANGTYTGLFKLPSILSSSGALFIDGNTGDNTLVKINGRFQGYCNTGQFHFRYFEIYSSGNDLFDLQRNGIYSFTEIRFGVCNNALNCYHNVSISLGNFTVFANELRFAQLVGNCTLDFANSVIDLENTPSFGFAFITLSNSFVRWNGSYINSGSATGRRFRVEDNSFFYSDNDPNTDLPGNIDGVVSYEYGYSTKFFNQLAFGTTDDLSTLGTLNMDLANDRVIIKDVSADQLKLGQATDLFNTTTLTTDSSPVVSTDNVIVWDTSANTARKMTLQSVIEWGMSTSNVETLSANKTLVITDAFLQLLNPNGADRDIEITAKRVGRIVNNSAGANALVIKRLGSTLATLSSASGNKAIYYHRLNDGTFYVEVTANY